MPPAWAQGTTLYRGVKVLSADADTPESYAAKVRADLRRIDRDDLDVTSTGWRGGRSSGARSFAPGRELHQRGIKVVFYIRCYVSADAANTEPPELFVEALSARLHHHHARGGSPISSARPSSPGWPR